MTCFKLIGRTLFYSLRLAAFGARKFKKTTPPPFMFPPLCLISSSQPSQMQIYLFLSPSSSKLPDLTNGYLWHREEVRSFRFQIHYPKSRRTPPALRHPIRLFRHRSCQFSRSSFIHSFIHTGFTLTRKKRP